MSMWKRRRLAPILRDGASRLLRMRLCLVATGASLILRSGRSPRHEGWAAGFALALAALGLASCVSVLPEASPAAPRYLISPVEFPATDERPVEWSLVIEDPLASRVYDTTKIALVRAPGRVEFYANGEWADRAPRLVQAAIIRSFENSGRILTVGDRIALPGGTFALQTDIRAMHADYSGNGPVAMFSIYARIATGRGRVLAARLFEERVPAAKDTVPEVAAAFDQAVTSAIGEIVGWSMDEAGEAYAK
ncbi:MAG: ABC-type transport auxiliary lipoprotein family protein [Amphiplicatus sp.]